MCGFAKLQIGWRGKRRLYFPDKKKYITFPPTDYLNPLPGVAGSSAADKHPTRHSSHQHGAGCSCCLVPEISVCDRYGCHLGRGFLTVPSLTLGSTNIALPAMALCGAQCQNTIVAFSPVPVGKGLTHGMPRCTGHAGERRMLKLFTQGQLVGVCRACVMGSLPCILPPHAAASVSQVRCCALLPLRRGTGASRSWCVSHAFPSSDL